MEAVARGTLSEGRRVLVVEQELAVGGLVRYALGQEGPADVEVVGTTEAALDYIRLHTPDLIVVDVSRPFEQKLYACRQLFTACRGGDVPIIVTCADLSEADRVLALDLGADDCLAQPFSPCVSFAVDGRPI